MTTYVPPEKQAQAKSFSEKAQGAAKAAGEKVKGHPYAAAGIAAGVAAAVAGAAFGASKLRSTGDDENSAQGA
ncbi:hypothetical protein SUS17_803 [Sphingomonas sp. S17]|uniref:Uncharacterized protein n=2 Tax=Sphingomonas paucimobilis TaxID=13689 RepID=A0A411LGV6_SPHPI|nr:MULTISPECIES: hypothetical protein [Sphingomonas]EGI56092.1 hypothetical protein SUS17_803 [Sphingomonas sp. S17]MBQ1481409.1 hypothetical protein [Sphingomonas sp.]MCM3677641.1 hypothetical protein [Sphingomonas paucimobilis]MDG5972268.1 hypothetical protein [Sphingomonas paucimobilis]NNG57753.1 hypothetical protein [Sphingomonas paucimobilis]